MYSGLMSDPYAHDAGPGVSWGKEEEEVSKKNNSREKKGFLEISLVFPKLVSEHPPRTQSHPSGTQASCYGYRRKVQW